MRGDLVMSTVAARSFKEQHPDSVLTLGIGPQYADMAPLFGNHLFFDDIHVYSTYENWPSNTDLAYLRRANHDIVYHGFPQHSEDQWWRFRHQYAEAVKMVGLPIPEDINPVLSQNFKVREDWKKDVIAFCPFAGFYNPDNDKRLSIERAQDIVVYLIRKGYRVLQLGGDDEPILTSVIHLNTNYFDSVKNMLACKALIHTDTGMGHIAGAYNHPSLGIYGYKYYGENLLKNIQPIHSNFVSISGPTVAEIPTESIFKSIDQLLS